MYPDIWDYTFHICLQSNKVVRFKIKMGKHFHQRGLWSSESAPYLTHQDMVNVQELWINLNLCRKQFTFCLQSSLSWVSSLNCLPITGQALVQGVDLPAYYVNTGRVRQSANKESRLELKINTERHLLPLSVTYIQDFQCTDSQTRALFVQKGQGGYCVRRGAAWSPGQTEKNYRLVR